MQAELEPRNAAYCWADKRAFQYLRFLGDKCKQHKDYKNIQIELRSIYIALCEMESDSLCDIQSDNLIKTCATYACLPTDTTKKHLDFLVQAGLLVRDSEAFDLLEVPEKYRQVRVQITDSDE